MSQNKKVPATIDAFRLAKTTTALPTRLATLDYLVPKAVKDLGQLIGLKADGIFAGWDQVTSQIELLDAYKELASTTAVLLDIADVGVISDEAIHSVSHRLAATVDPLVSLNARVDHLYRAYVNGEADGIRDDSQKLWAALEFRCESVTGQTFAQLLTED